MPHRLTVPLVCVLLSLACAHDARRPGSTDGAGYDALLTDYAYPFPVHFHDVSSQGLSLRMAYMDVAPETPNGATVVLLHGKNFSGAYWERTIRALTAAGYRVVVPDQIGFGKSSKPAPYQFTLHGLAYETHRLLASLGVSRAAVVGHSMGGMLATRYALMYPEAVGALVLVNPIGLEDWKRVVGYRSVDELEQGELKQTPESIRGYMQDSYFAGEWKPAYDPLVEILAGWQRGPDRARIARVAALTTEMVLTQPVLYEFPDVRAPTLLVIGQRDRTAIGRAWVPAEVGATLGDYPVLGRRAAEAIPDAQLVELEGVGHMPQVEAFDAYIEAITAFLAAQDS